MKNCKKITNHKSFLESLFYTINLHIMTNQQLMSMLGENKELVDENNRLKKELVSLGAWKPIPDPDMFEYKIISSRTPDGLSNKINEYIDKGWKPVDGHKVVEIHRDNRYSGTQHMDTRIELEYSQTIVLL